MKPKLYCAIQRSGYCERIVAIPVVKKLFWGKTTTIWSVQWFPSQKKLDSVLLGSATNEEEILSIIMLNIPQVIDIEMIFH